MTLLLLLQMAHFHASLTCLSRSKGHSAVAAAAYRSGQSGRDLRTNMVHDFTRRKVVTFSQIFVPDGAQKCDRFDYWNQAEAAERRKNSTVARDLVLSLPVELPHAARVQLIEVMAKWLNDRYQCLVDAVLHDPSHMNDPRNFHAHLLMSTRRITSSGFSEKCRELDDLRRGRSEVRRIRATWCDVVNSQLERHGFDVRVDHRSNLDRDLLELPTIRHGRGPDATRRKEYNEAVRSLNRKLREASFCSDQNKPDRTYFEDEMRWEETRSTVARER